MLSPSGGAASPQEGDPMTAALEHRAHSSFTIATPWVSILAIAIGVVTGAALALAALPDARGLAIGAGYGLVPGVLSAIGVSVARRAVLHRRPFWRVLAVVVLAVAVATGLLFSLAQLAIEVLPVGVLLGAWTSLIATFVGLLRVRR
jgi:hypothetical protein